MDRPGKLFFGISCFIQNSLRYQLPRTWKYSYLGMCHIGISYYPYKRDSPPHRKGEREVRGRLSFNYCQFHNSANVICFSDHITIFSASFRLGITDFLSKSDTYCLDMPSVSATCCCVCLIFSLYSLSSMRAL